MAIDSVEKEKELFLSYYSSERFLELLILPPRVNFHHFRIQLFSDGKQNIFKRVKKVINHKEDLQNYLLSTKPQNVYCTPTQWLDPTNVRRCRDDTVSDVMLSAPLYFDIDSKQPNPEAILESKSTVEKLIDFIRLTHEISPDLVVFSGRRGFHVYYWNWVDTDFFELSPNQRVLYFIKSRNQIVKQLRQNNIVVDQSVTSDPWRILRLPGTLHGSTGLSAISIQDIHKIKTYEDIYQKAAVFPLEFYREIFGSNHLLLGH